MIILDRSGSMSGNRITSALAVLFSLLDADGDGVVEVEDQDILGVSLGQMSFYNMPSSSCSPFPYIILPESTYNGITSDTFGTSYPDLWSNINTTSVNRYTPNGPALYWASRYTQEFDSTHPDLDCRNYYIILITDGLSNKYGTDGSYLSLPSSNTNQGSWSLVREAAMSYRERDIPVFTVGFGTGITEMGRNELNWAAYWGGTENPNHYNYTDMDYNPAHTHVSDPWTWPMPIPSNWGNTNGWYNPRSTTNNSYSAYPPSHHQAEGYAFIAQNADELADALRDIFQSILNNSFSFSPASIPVVRTTVSDTSIIYATFRPAEGGFWDGQVKSVVFHGDTTLGDDIWTAGESLLVTNGSSRDMYFTNFGVKSLFTTGNVSPIQLGPAITNIERDVIVGRTRNGWSTTEPGWKMGDVFHSAPLMVGQPSPFYTGNLSYVRYRIDHTYRDDRKRVYVGTNTGTIHCLNSLTGHEEWAWIPGFALEKLKIWALDGDHTYIMDGPVTAADLWSDLDQSGTEDADDWRTLLIMGQREGGTNYIVLDVTEVPLDPDTSDFPKFVGEISGSVTGTGPRTFANTWSQPTAGQFLVDPNQAANDTAISLWGYVMGGGYTSDGAGGSVVDSGNFLSIWTPYENTYLNFGFNSPEQYGIASSISLIDFDVNYYADQVITPDLGGNLLIMETQGDTNPASWSLNNTFQPETDLPADADLNGFFAVSVARDNNGDWWYCYGTGDRDNPMEVTHQGYFFMVKNPPLFGAPLTVNGNLDTLTSNLATPGVNGWFFRQPYIGEKVTSTPLIYQNLVYWTTFEPDTSTAGPCDIGAGTARMYVASIGATGQLVDSINLGHVGIPSSPQITVGPDGPVVVVMTSAGPEVLEIHGPGYKKKYVYWNEVY